MAHPVPLTYQEARQHLLALADIFYDMGFSGNTILLMIQKVLDDWAEIYGTEFKGFYREIRRRMRI